ncbi:hypothetical protein [Pseudidiomarina gelatinasegens]|uniref:hypothetical protein n=1 Tax=Pseudidiomarina gelatinasegens TaxID=2487740 RepID=UPI0030EE570D
MKAVFLCGMCAATLLGSSAVQAQDTQAQPMLNDPYFDRARQAEQQQVNLLQVDKATFRAAYDKAGKPKLVMLVGEPFSDMVSDWHMQRRVSVNAQATGTEGTFVPESQSVQVGVEQRGYDNPRRSSMLSAAQWDEYQRGYQSMLMSFGVRLVNRSVAMRLLDSEIRAETSRNPQDDNQRLEMDMLRKHTNLLIEVMPYRETKMNYEPIGYHITMTSLDDATLLADDRVPIPQGLYEYGATAGGYELQRPRNVAGVTAQAGGYEVIEEQAELWAEQGQLAAQATLQMLYDRYL